jgi:hypothetical protein
MLYGYLQPECLFYLLFIFFPLAFAGLKIASFRRMSTFESDSSLGNAVNYGFSIYFAHFVKPIFHLLSSKLMKLSGTIGISKKNLAALPLGPPIILSILYQDK